ncbi:MAG: hypothetical protein KZQ80_11755 [Candidatus Thiodiazotropha sp. (ex Monitilora ramsayi)]|nr:hypothetical protein [Candidatus Thiodiazotropha sp. (ex Monitilora ramsayi)]
MHKKAITHALVILLSLTACSWESAKRSTYETVESMRIQQCLDRPDDPDCSTRRQRYETYEAEHKQQTGTQE